MFFFPHENIYYKVLCYTAIVHVILCKQIIYDNLEKVEVLFLFC